MDGGGMIPSLNSMEWYFQETISRKNSLHLLAQYSLPVLHTESYKEERKVVNMFSVSINVLQETSITWQVTKNITGLDTLHDFKCSCGVYFPVSPDCCFPSCPLKATLVFCSWGTPKPPYNARMGQGRLKEAEKTRYKSSFTLHLIACWFLTVHQPLSDE